MSPDSKHPITPTPRERDLMMLIARGMQNKNIAYELKISENTVRAHIGNIMRKFGLTIDNLRSCDVVTADGDFVVASEQENPELFWGLRGGGGNFGIVTSFEFDLHPVGPTVLAGLLFFPAESARQVITGWRELTRSMPDWASVLVAPTVNEAEPVVAA